jgi:hypothetical protein
MSIIKLLPFRKKIDGQPRDKVICLSMANEEHYFQGVADVPLPSKFGMTSMKTNLWIPHYNALKDHAGFFTQSEAEFYLEIIATDGVVIKTKSEIEATL